MNNFLDTKIDGLVKQNNWQAVINELKPLSEKPPVTEFIWSNLAFAYTQLNQNDKARYCYKQWVEQYPKTARAFYGLGYTFYNEKQWKEAIEQFDIALEIFPAYIVVLYRRGVALLNMFKSEPARQSLDKAIREFQKLSPERQKRSAKYFYKSIFYLGKAYFNLGNFHNALACFSKVANEDKRNYIEPEFKIYNQAKTCFAAKNYTDAEKYIRLLMEEKPLKNYIPDLLGQIFEAQEEYNRALFHYRQALDSRPQPFIYAHLAHCFVQMGELAEAENHYHLALKRDQLGKHKTFLALSRLSAARGDYQQAVRYAENAVQFKKDKFQAEYYDAQIALGEYYEQLGDSNKSKAAYQLASELKPEFTFETEEVSEEEYAGDLF